ncbi:MAG: sulfatase [Acidobacteriota bacterium]
MKKNSSVFILSIGIIAGTLIGFFKSGIIGKFSEIISNRYFSYGSFRIIWLKLQPFLLEWLIYTLATSILFLFIVFSIRKKRIVERVLNKGKSRRRINFISITALVIFTFLCVVNITSTLVSVSGSGKGPNIIIIVVDALREDTLGANGYKRDTSPNIDEFAERSVVFKNAYSSSSWTKPAVASLFSSLDPIKHNTLSKNDGFPDAVHTLTEILNNKGYNTYFLGGGNHFLGKHFNFNQGFNYYFNKRSDAAELTERFISLLPELKKGKFFTYLHYMDTHLPYGKNKYNYLFSGKKKINKLLPGKIFRWTVNKLKKKKELTPDDKKYLRDLYDGQVRYVDENIGKLLDVFKQELLLNNTLVIITSDHGEEFWDHNGFEHGHSLYNELIHIPLIIGGKGLGPSVKEKSVRIIDIFPTVLKVTKTPLPEFDIDGTSFKRKLSGGDAGVDLTVFASGILYGNNKYCLVQNKKKIILNTFNKNVRTRPDFRAYKFFEYYDLSLDSKEARNLSEIKKTETSKQVKILKKYILADPAFNKKKVRLDKKIRDRLKSLGYI